MFSQADVHQMIGHLDPRKIVKKILTMSTYALIGFILSWVYFFISLPLVVRIFGKVKGATINYGISWVVMVAVIYVLQKLKPEHKIPQPVDA